MQAQQYFTNFRLKITLVWQTPFARFVVLGSLLLVMVAFMWYLAGHVSVPTTIFSFVMGHTHTAISTGRQLTDLGDPWPVPVPLT